MNFFRWLASRRTTLMGYLGVVGGVLELNADTIGEWVSKPKRGILLLILGMAVAAIGHYNQQQRDRPDA